MKKFSFILLFSILTVFLLSGCSDDNDNNGGGTGIPDIVKPYVGTYDVTFFATKPSSGGTFDMAAIGTMTTDCAEAGELGILEPVDSDSPNVAKECKINGEKNTDIANIIGQQAVITYNETAGLVIETKLQIWKEIMALSPNDTYQYTKYAAVPVANITEEGINMDTATAVKGVSGRNLTETSENPLSTFKITKQADGSLYVELDLVDKVTLVGKVNAPTYVILEKKSEIVDPINPNELFKTESGIEAADKIYADFKTEPTEPAE